MIEKKAANDEQNPEVKKAILEQVKKLREQIKKMEKKHLDHLAKESAERKELEDAQNHQDAVYHAQKKIEKV